MTKNYYLGLDIGTESIGWAATDGDYNLLKARGRDLWGSYLLEQAQSAEKRRGFRTGRRRLARRRRRIDLLQALFAQEIAAVDPLFFLRLNNSSLFAKDKDGKLTTADALFADGDYRDKHFFKEYATIYHLRSSLIDGEARDVRLLYLAVHHIIKNRGHFLFEAQSFKPGDSEIARNALFDVNAFLSDREMPSLGLQSVDEILAVIKDKKVSRRDRQLKLAQLFGAGKDKCLLAVIKAITGGTVKLKELYGLEEDSEDIKSFSFEKSGFDEDDFPAIQSVVGDDEAELVRLLKVVYDWSVLCSIMGEEKYISRAKVKIFEKHRADLQLLKAYVRGNCPEKYAEVFRKHKDKNNYAAYIGMDRRKGFKKCSREDFYAFLKKLPVTDGYILAEMEKGEFLPKQVAIANGVIPYQVNLYELKAILENAARVFPFLNREEGGTTVAQKIIQLCTFRIPYYVGPLNSGSEYTNAVRRAGQERTSVTPWNFDEVIDRDASEEKFIRGMTNKCTYLKGEDVLPANSLLYSRFTFLNELNNLRINKVQDAAANRLIYNYALAHKKVTLKACLKLLKSEGLLPADSTVEVFSGTDGDFKASLAPWVDFKFLGEKVDTHRDMCEQIIVWLTLISDKSRLEKRIRSAYGNILSDEEIKKIKSLNYTKWGRLSARFLNGIISPYCADDDGQPLTIIEAMSLKGKNLMELLSNDYGYLQAIDEENGEVSQNIAYCDIKGLRCSPLVKRPIWRTIELVREVIKICGCPPKKIFVEMAREIDDGSRKGDRKLSRKQQIIDLYKSIRGEEREWVKEIEGRKDSEFNSDKLVLYYRQLGRCMYTGKPIPLNEVFNTNICDKDHIYPRSKIKDDSLDNLVLVYKTVNKDKDNEYPIKEDIRRDRMAFWKELLGKGLISQRKYDRLTRATPLTQDELADFINRQIVCTQQSTKLVAKLLGQMLPNTKIVYSKAANANVLKDELKFVKVRELNDLHHAKDAYANIVAGNVWDCKFNGNARDFFRSSGVGSYNLEHLYDYDIPGAWRIADRGRIRDTMLRNTCSVVRMTVDGTGALFDTKPVSAGKNEGLVPLKQNGAMSDTARYGGYNKAATAYFMLVRSVGKKGKVMLSLEAYPLWREKQTGGSVEDKLDFCVANGLVEPQILVDRIKLNTLFKINGSYAWLRGKSDARVLWCNANQLFLDEQYVRILKNICKYVNKTKQYNNSGLEADSGICAADNLKLYDEFVNKLSSPIYAGLSVSDQVKKLVELRDKFVALTIEEQCTVLFEVLRFMQCNPVLSDLSRIGGVANAGINRSSKFIQDMGIKLIYQSPTGYWRKVIDLKEFL